MTEKRKPAPAIAAPERAKEKAALTGAAISITNNTTTEAHCPHISDFLLHGAENAVPRRYLETVTGLDGRTVRKLIAMERLHGVPILSDCTNGYFLPSSKAEMDRFVKSMRRRAGEILRVAEAVEQTER